MNPEQLALFLSAGPNELPRLIRHHQLALEHIEALKAHSADYYLSKPAAALSIAQLAHDISVHLPIPAPALGRWTLANALIFVNRYTDAAALFAQAVADYRRADLPLEAARASVGYVGVLAYLGDLDGAIALAQETEPLLIAADSVADRTRLDNLRMNLGVVYELRGEYEEALAVYERQHQQAQDAGDGLLAARILHNRALVLVLLNAFDDALAAFAAAEASFVKAQAHADLVRLAINQFALLITRRRFADADRAYQAAQHYLAQAGELEQQAHRLAIMLAWRRLQQYAAVGDDTLHALQQAQQSFAVYGPTYEEALSWIMLGRCHLARHELRQASGAFLAAHQLTERGIDRSLAHQVLHGLALVAEQEYDSTGALAYYQAALREIELARRELQVELLRAGFLADKLSVYQDFALFHLRHNEFEAAFVVLERARCRLLVEKLAARLTTEVEQLTNVADHDLRTWSRELTLKLQELERFYDQARRAAQYGDDETGRYGGVPDKDDVPGYDQKDTARYSHAAIRTLEQEVQRLIDQIQRRQPVLSPLATGAVISLSQLQSHLQGVVLLQYQIFHEEVWLFVIDGAGVQEQRPLCPVDEVVTARDAFAAAVERTLEMAVQYGRQRTMRYLPALLADANRQLERLDALLMAPVRSALPVDQTLIVAPDGPLHYVPFHSLYDGEAYLVERRPLAYAPSATVLDLCLKRSTATANALLVGYDDRRLLAVSAEIETVGRLYPHAATFVQEQATAAALLAAAPHYGLIHLAAHATFRRDKPMLSSLALADRRLTLGEIARLRLAADLVVLSGCETGHGEMKGADLLSLAGGFLGSGARSLVVSLWRVEDRVTAEFMAVFYHQLLAGQSRAAALQAAQVTVLTRGRQALGEQALYRHPAFWAPFTLIGDWRPLGAHPDSASLAR